MSDPPATPDAPAVPLPNGPNGRGHNGRFTKGNPGGPGGNTQYGRNVAELRAALFRAVTPEVIERIVASLVREAEKGNIGAAREILHRCLGEPQAIDLIERLEALEAAERAHPPTGNPFADTQRNRT